jgi:hypothetical protein
MHGLIPLREEELKVKVASMAFVGALAASVVLGLPSQAKATPLPASWSGGAFVDTITVLYRYGDRDVVTAQHHCNNISTNFFL